MCNYLVAILLGVILFLLLNDTSHNVANSFQKSISLRFGKSSNITHSLIRGLRESPSLYSAFTATIVSSLLSTSNVGISFTIKAHFQDWLEMLTNFSNFSELLAKTDGHVGWNTRFRIVCVHQKLSLFKLVWLLC